MSRKTTEFRYMRADGTGSGLEMRRLNESSRSIGSNSSSDNEQLRRGRSRASGAIIADSESNLHQQLFDRSEIGLQATRHSNRSERMNSRREKDGGMPQMIWSSDGIEEGGGGKGGRSGISVSQLISHYAARLPVIVKVSQGYYGDGQIQLPIGQVLQISSYCHENRVRATDSTGRWLSFPSNFLHSIDVVLSGRSVSPTGAGAVRTSGSTKKLSEFLKSSQLPVTVSVVRSSINASNTTPFISLPSEEEELEELTIHCVYTCNHLLANPIENGWLNSHSIVTIPEDLNPRFRVALGLKDATTDEWKDYSGMFDRAARHIRFSTITGYQGVIYDEWSEFSVTYSEEESDEPVTVNIENYLITRQEAVQPHLHCQESPEVQQVKRFPKTSPHLAGRRKSHASAASHAAVGTLAASFISSTDSLETKQDVLCGPSSRTRRSSGPSSSELPEISLRAKRESHEPTYINVDELELDRCNVTTTSRTDEEVVQERTGASKKSPDPRRGGAQLSDVHVVLVEGSRTKLGDDRGTLTSIDEGYSTKDSSRSCETAKSNSGTAESVGRIRYSPVYF